MTDTSAGLRAQQEYFAHLAAGRFMIQRSHSSGEHVFYPRVAAPRTGARDLEWVPASGRGTVYATTVMRVKPPAAPYNVCLVQLEEGPRMMGRVENIDPQAVTVGMAVRARIARDDAGQPMVVFDPAPGEQAGVKPADFDVVELYDAFTLNTILFLEDLGFCAEGEGAAFVAGGCIAPGGPLPVNTNGGGLSCVHPGMYGLFTMVEAAQQLASTAGERQVPGARLALAHGNGGELSSQATLVLGTEETL